MADEQQHHDDEYDTVNTSDAFALKPESITTLAQAEAMIAQLRKLELQTGKTDVELVGQAVVDKLHSFLGIVPTWRPNPRLSDATVQQLEQTIADKQAAQHNAYQQYLLDSNGAA